MQRRYSASSSPLVSGDPEARTFWWRTGEREVPHDDDSAPASEGWPERAASNPAHWDAGERAARRADSRGNWGPSIGLTDPRRAGHEMRREAPPRRQGPKGYARSDDRIREDVCERLIDARGLDVSDVGVQVRDGRVELEGSVPVRWMKHGVEDIADSCSGVRDVENRVRVRRPDEGAGEDGAQRTAASAYMADDEPDPSETGLQPRR